MSNSRIIWVSVAISVVIVTLIYACATALAHDDALIDSGDRWHDQAREDEYNAERGVDHLHWHFSDLVSSALHKCYAMTYDDANNRIDELAADKCINTEAWRRPVRRPSVQSRSSTSSTITTSIPVRQRQSTSVYNPVSQQPQSSCINHRRAYFKFDVGETFYTPINGYPTLYDFWANCYKCDLSIYHEGEWQLYVGEGELGEIELSPHFAVSMTRSLSHGWGFSWHRYCSITSIELEKGINFFGFPYPPGNYDYPSDFLSDLITEVIITKEGERHSITSESREHDDPIYPGQAFIMYAEQAHTLYFDMPAAPQAQRHHKTLTTSWGAVKEAK